ncbi:unnamed protein product, partial [Symbiodinium sp. KB8]
MAIVAILLSKFAKKKPPWPFKKLQRGGKHHSNPLPMGGDDFEERKRDFARTVAPKLDSGLLVVTPSASDPTAWSSSKHGSTGDMSKEVVDAAFEEFSVWLKAELTKLKKSATEGLCERVVDLVSVTEGFKFATENQVPPFFPQIKFILVLGSEGQVRVIWTAYITNDPKPNMSCTPYILKLVSDDLNSETAAGEAEKRGIDMKFVGINAKARELLTDAGKRRSDAFPQLETNAHERSVDADLLSLVLKLQLQHKLADFKIVIMSATLQGPNAPHFKIPPKPPLSERSASRAMSEPAEGSQKVQVDRAAETSIILRSFAGIESRLDELAEQVDACLQELLGLKKASSYRHKRSSHRHRDTVLPVIPSDRPTPAPESEPVCLLHTQQPGSVPRSSVPKPRSRSSFFSFGSDSTVSDAQSRMSTISNAGSLRNEMVSFKEEKAQVVEYTPPEWKDKKRRVIQPVRKVDLKIAWQIHAKELKKQAAADEETRPIMRLIYRSRCDHLWEMLDDPDSSMAAWAVSQFLKVLVLVSVVLSMLVTTQEPLVDVSTSAVL